MSVTVSVVVSLGTKPAQAAGKWWIARRLVTGTLPHILFPLSQDCRAHLIILPTHSCWLKSCHKTELNESISGRMIMLNSINTVLQNVSAKPIDSKPYRISDLKKLRGQQRTRRIPKLHVRLALVDASAVKSKRKNACQR